MAKKSKSEIERMVEDQARGKKVSAKDSGKGKLDKRRSKSSMGWDVKANIKA